MDFNFVKYVHVASVIILMAASACKNLFLHQKETTRSRLYQALLTDKISGAAAGILIITGLLMIFGIGHGRVDYLKNPYFLAKMAVLLLASALIIQSKIYLRKNATKAATSSVQVPFSIRLILVFDFFAICALIYFAHAMVNISGKV